MKKFSLVFLILLSAVFNNKFAGAAPAGANEETLLSDLKNAKTSDSRTKALKQVSDYYLSVNRIDRAVDSYRRTINDEKISNKDKYCYYMVIGDIYLGARQYSSALEFYQEAINVSPGQEDARLKLAGVYEQCDLNELARQAYTDDLKFNKRSFYADFGLASLFKKLGLNTQAMEYYRRALTIRPAPEVYRNIALCAETAGDVAIALAMLRQIPAELRTYGDLIALGRLYLENNRRGDAEEAFSSAIKTDTENIEGYVDLALLYLDNNELNPAQNLLDIAIEKMPREGSLHFFLGCVYSAQKKPVLAREEMLQAEVLGRSDILKKYSAKFENFLSNGHN